MDINKPDISRTLAILIQPVVAEDRWKFIKDAEEAPDLETFIKSINQYRTI